MRRVILIILLGMLLCGCQASGSWEAYTLARRDLQSNPPGQTVMMLEGMHYKDKAFIGQSQSRILTAFNHDTQIASVLVDGDLEAEEGKALSEMITATLNTFGDLLKEENVFIGSQHMIPIADGDVKVKSYTLKPTSEQLNTILMQLAPTHNDAWVSLCSSIQVLRYDVEAFIDVDQALVQEIIRLHVRFKDNPLLPSIGDELSATLTITYLD